MCLLSNGARSSSSRTVGCHGVPCVNQMVELIVPRYRRCSEICDVPCNGHATISEQGHPACTTTTIQCITTSLNTPNESLAGCRATSANLPDTDGDLRPCLTTTEAYHKYVNQQVAGRYGLLLVQTGLRTVTVLRCSCASTTVPELPSSRSALPLLRPNQAHSNLLGLAAA